MKIPHLASSLCMLVGAATVSSEEVYTIHGSGTTNPSKCLWLIMGQIMDRSRGPTHLSYRAVGSGNGIKEFLGVNNTGDFAYVPYNQFGAGDIPVPSESFTVVPDGMVHLPFVMGAISFFHNVPVEKLNLTGCTLAKIFKRKIKYWDDPEIVALNDGLKELLPYEDYPITVARRVHGSSSTASITQYLNKECPAEWPAEDIGKEVDWNTETQPCEGSGGMTECIRSIEGAIGYMDAGHGWEENLKEIELRNFDQYYISSQEAAARGGIGSAADDLPTSADADFGNVNLINKPGRWTWPIVAQSYIYVRKNLSFIADPIERGLLKIFLQSLYEDEYINQCTQFGFTIAPNATRTLALNGIDLIDFDDAEVWSFEYDTLPLEGQTPYVISSKRRTYSEYDRSVNDGSIQDMSSLVMGMEKQIMELRDSLAKLEDSVSHEHEMDIHEFSDEDSTKLEASLVLSSISFSIVVLGLAFLLVKKFLGI